MRTLCHSLARELNEESYAIEAFTNRIQKNQDMSMSIISPVNENFYSCTFCRVSGGCPEILLQKLELFSYRTMGNTFGQNDPIRNPIKRFKQMSRNSSTKSLQVRTSHLFAVCRPKLQSRDSETATTTAAGAGTPENQHPLHSKQ